MALDHTTRIYSKLTPDADAHKLLQTIVASLAERVKGRPVDESKWHVTILHFGIAQHVFYDIKREHPGLSEQTFTSSLKNYLERTSQKLPRAMTLQPSSFELLGVREDVLALSFAVNDALENAHIQALGDLCVFLQECGLDDPESFMKGSINFKWAHQLKPHITLMRSAQDVNIASLPLPQTLLGFDAGSINC